MNRDLQIELGRRFRRLHEDGTFVMPNAWDAGSALLLETAGFEAIGTTSAGIAYALGKADATGALSIDEALEETARIAGAVSVPVNVDAENGYGDSPEAVAECIRRCIGAGAVGAGIEDYTRDPARPLYDRALAVERIRAAREAVDASGVPFVLTARAECYLYGVPGAFAESVARSNLYREAGADLLYTPGVKDRSEVAALVREIDGPMNFVVGKATARLHRGGACRARHPPGEHRGVAAPRHVRARRARGGGDEGSGPVHLGRRSARPRGLRSALRAPPRRMNRGGETPAPKPAMPNRVRRERRSAGGRRAAAAAGESRSRLAGAGCASRNGGVRIDPRQRHGARTQRRRQ